MADGNAVAASLEHYVHKAPYKWGGAKPSGWDCSGAVNYCLCHILGYNIPGYKGGTFSGNTHGPNTVIWLQWNGLHSKTRAKVARGDLVIWYSHMGIAVNNTHYVSAYGTGYGTVVMPIHGGGPIGETATFWSLRQPASSAKHGHGSGGGGGGGGTVGGKIPGGNPTASKQWNDMQAAWSSMRNAFGPFSQAKVNQIVSVIKRMDKVSRL